MKPVGNPPVDWLGVPLRNRENKTIGVLAVQSYSDRYRYTENDQNILAFLSSQVALAIERRKAEEALRSSEARQGALLNAIPDLIFVIDHEGRVTDYKAPFGTNGIPLVPVLSKLIQDSLSTKIAETMIFHAQKVLNSGKVELFECEVPMPNPGGEIRHLEVRMSASDKSHVLTLIRDISEKRQAENNIEQQRTLLRKVIDVNPNFIYAKDRQGRFTLANQAFAQAYGTTVEELIGKTDSNFNPNEQEVKQFLRDDLEVIDNNHGKYIEEESITDSIGNVRRMQTVKLPFVIPGSTEIQVLGVSTDITYAFQDSLTRLPNRRVFVDRLGRVLRRLKRFSSTISAVLMLDLDRFAMVNESFGHYTGDELLILAAQRLQMSLRTVDTVARMGGDEFAILVEDLESVNSIIQIAERVINEISLPFELQDQRVVISASIGIVLCASDYEPENILRDADIALHRAKAAGKGRYEFFEETMWENVRNKLQLDTDLRQAINRNELALHFEPIIDIRTGRVKSLEALLRWHNPERGLVKPGLIIPLLEETGLIIPIGEWVFREACRLMSLWHKNLPATSDISISVNLSTKQFLQKNLVSDFSRIISETGFDPHYLHLEITESAIIENETLVIAALENFRAMGIHIYMDDFGTGYSSLVNLHKLPLNAIKIDRSFISGRGNLLNGAEIVRTIIHLANDLHLETIAECVETKEQLNMLRMMGCNYVQGFLFTPTMPSQATETFLCNQEGMYTWIKP